MSEKHKSWKNYDNHLNRKEQLKNAVLQHPEEGKDGKSLYDFMQSEVKHDMWIVPYKEFHKRINKKK
jgi:hypothetical protein